MSTDISHIKFALAHNRRYSTVEPYYRRDRLSIKIPRLYSVVSLGSR